jgi:S-DNA-T family DNA segregation ATPase FtsK/SpoIIIE
VAAIVRSVRRSDAGVRAVLVTPTRSPLLGRVEWHRVASGVDDVASICEEVQQLASDVGNRIVLVVESPADFLNSAADLPLQDLVKTVRLNGHLVVAEGDTQSMAGSWPLLQALRFSRRGIVLQPDQTDGDLLLRTSFPRIRRADFPCGRGLLVREGRVMKVQVAQV